MSSRKPPCWDNMRRCQLAFFPSIFPQPCAPSVDSGEDLARAGPLVITCQQQDALGALGAALPWLRW